MKIRRSFNKGCEEEKSRQVCKAIYYKKQAILYRTSGAKYIVMAVPLFFTQRQKRGFTEVHRDSPVVKNKKPNQEHLKFY
ncbi:hypothetical protein DIT68_13760 [Brumimicrobium oceani]|uniref:Uncharacterized protein n=1 Tax=Brumimicrobium oceani TaxID=2100725 RepID=A0A2U2X587_9FLAO|nr:hypothetical protein DIT68_13760 [Brumimicrobium oceani]